MALINGTSYAWDSVVLNLFGQVIEGVKAVSFKESQEKVNNYGRGTRPISRGRGRKTYEASITLEMKEWARIQRALPTGRTLADIAPFPVTVSWISEDNIPFTVILEDAEFTEAGVDVSEGDTGIDIEMPLIISGIRFA